MHRPPSCLARRCPLAPTSDKLHILPHSVDCSAAHPVSLATHVSQFDPVHPSRELKERACGGCGWEGGYAAKPPPCCPQVCIFPSGPAVTGIAATSGSCVMLWYVALHSTCGPGPNGYRTLPRSVVAPLPPLYTSSSRQQTMDSGLSGVVLGALVEFLPKARVAVVAEMVRNLGSAARRARDNVCEEAQRGQLRSSIGYHSMPLYSGPTASRNNQRWGQPTYSASPSIPCWRCASSLLSE